MELYTQLSVLWGWDFRGSSKPVLPPLLAVAAILMVFTAIIVMHMLVFRTTGSQEWGDENRIS